MNGFRHLDYDPDTGITTQIRFNRDSAGKRISTDFLTTQDVTPILDANAAERYDGKGKATQRGRLGMKVASIPLSVIQEWKNVHGVDLFSQDPDQQKKIRQLLNDAGYYKLRVAEINL